MIKTRAVTPEILKKLVVLNALSDEHLQSLAKTVKMEEHPKGSTMFKQGESDGMALYLLRGKLDLLDAGGSVVRQIESGTPETKHPLVHQQPRAYTAVSAEPVVIVRIDSQTIDMMITWDQSKNYVVEDIAQDEEVDDDDWMTRMLQTKSLHKIPPANIQAMFLRMQEINVSAGHKVVEQGGEGDFYYIIKRGKCRVTRSTRSNPAGAVLAELGVGDSFGEEALISDEKRNATVTMVTDGILMRLGKEDFVKLLNQPMIKRIKFDEALKQVEAGAIWLDVRMPSEYENGHLEGSINVPFYLLRNRVDSLQADREYIVCCDTGSRSSAVAYLLSERGFSTRVLQDGLVAAHKDKAA